jgi:hypothetical protein
VRARERERERERVCVCDCEGEFLRGGFIDKLYICINYECEGIEKHKENHKEEKIETDRHKFKIRFLKTKCRVFYDPGNVT